MAAGIYLNTGSVGPMPAETAAAMAELTDYELRTGRAHADYFDEMLQRMAEARSAVAAVLTADVDDIALTHSTTDGMNIGIWSIDWQPGDRAVTTDLEHAGGVGGLLALRDRLGIDVAVVAIPEPSDDAAIVAAFDAAIDARTRAVVISHVLWATGRLLPIAEIASVAHDPRRLADRGWGPERRSDADRPGGDGSGRLLDPGAEMAARRRKGWVRSRSDPRQGIAFVLLPPGISASSISTCAVSPASGPTRGACEASNYHRPSIAGMARSIGWLSMYVGLDWIYERGAAMARLAADRLGSIVGVEVLDPARPDGDAGHLPDRRLASPGCAGRTRCPRLCHRSHDRPARCHPDQRRVLHLGGGA
ncbi:MAG: aminotransferase class V-fold PLP-dependent enzyme [Candidatus Limnocylindrales bacterium]